MAQRPSVVVPETTEIPDDAEIARVAAFAHEPFVLEDESADEVLAPGTIRRHAFEFARAELEAGGTVPSQKWRRRWSLLLGLDRALHTETPVLADGTTLNPHQVDALSGTYAALLADAQRRTRGTGQSDGDALLLSFEDDEPAGGEAFPDEPPPQLAPEDDEPDDDVDADDPDDEPTGDTGEFAAVAPAADEDDDEDDAGDGLAALEAELEELPEAEPESESALYDDDQDEDVDEDIDAVALDDPNAHKRFWFEHATGAGKTVAAMGFVEACRTGGILILTHRRNLVDQFIDELQTRGYGARLSKPLLGDADIDTGHFDPSSGGPVTIETYQWFVRNAGQISGAYTVVICDEAHTALGEKTSATIRAWTGPIFIGMTATGALIARHVTDLFPTQTSRFDLAQAARRGVIAPLRSLRIPPGPGVRTIAKVPLRKGEVDMEFDQDELAKLLDQAPFNLAIADLYRTRFRNTPGVVYTAGVQHAYNVAESFRALDMKAEAVSGETPKRELAKILADYEAGEIDVLVNAQLLAEGWNSPRATICMHLAPTASKRIYQQRVGRVTRRHPGKEAGVVIDFVHPATGNDDPVVTLHSLLDRDVYRGGAIVVGPVRRGRGRRVKVERRVLPVTPDIERRRQVFERELWRIAVEQLDWGEQRVWAALAGAKASPTNWRRGRAMLNFDRSGELRRQFLVTALERNKHQQLRMRAVQEIAVLREADPFDTAIDQVGQWPRDDRREASRVLLQAMADRRIGRREQATAWIWRLAEYTRDMHEEYAAQRWPATKHLLGLLVNSSGAAHARNARRLVHAARQHDRRLQAALLAAAVAHTPDAEEVLREARTRLARKPGALSRDLLKDFPSGKRRKKRSRNKKKQGGAEGGAQNGQVEAGTDAQAAEGDESRQPVAVGAEQEFEAATFEGGGQTGGPQGGTGRRSRSRRGRSRGGRRRGGQGGGQAQGGQGQGGDEAQGGDQASGDRQASDTPPGDAQGSTGADPRQDDGRSNGGSRGGHDGDTSRDDGAPAPRRRIRGQKAAAAAAATTDADGSDTAPDTPDEAPARPSRRRRRAAAAAAAAESAGEASGATPEGAAPPDTAEPTRARRTRSTAGEESVDDAPTAASAVDAAPAASRARRTRSAAAADDAPAEDAPKPARARRTAKAAAADAPAEDAPKPARARRTTKVAAGTAAEDAPKPARARRTAKAAATDDAPAEDAPKPARARRTAKAAATDDAPAEDAPKTTRARRTTKAAATDDAPAEDAPKTTRARRTTKVAADTAAEDAPKPARARRTTKAAATDDAPAEDAPKTTRARRTTSSAAAEDAPAAPARRTRATTAKPATATRATAAKKTATTAKTAAKKTPAKKAPVTKPAATKRATAAATKAAATKTTDEDA